MVNLKRVSFEILNDGLYNMILIAIKDEFGADKISNQEDIEQILKNHPKFIEEYKELNRMSEISSIHIKELPLLEINGLNTTDKEQEIIHFRKELNNNIQILKNLESFEIANNDGAYAIWILSAGAMIIFLAHNIFALFTELYATNPLAVYGFYAGVLGLTFYSYIKIKINHAKKHKIFSKIYDKVKLDITKGLNRGFFTKDEILS